MLLFRLFDYVILQEKETMMNTLDLINVILLQEHLSTTNPMSEIKIGDMIILDIRASRITETKYDVVFK